MDGALQGAADYRWVSLQFMAASAVSFACQFWVVRWELGLIGVWAGLRMIAVVRVIAGYYRLRSGRSRISLGKQPAQPTAAGGSGNGGGGAGGLAPAAAV